MQTTNAMQKQNFPASKMFATIYLIIDPGNSEAHYLNANILAIEGKEKETIEALDGAIKNGFTDVARVENDALFGKMKENEDFKAILKKMTAADSTAIH